MYETKPWVKFYGHVPESIDYPRVTMYEALMKTVASRPDAIAWDFFGTTCTYRQFGEMIRQCANALAALGLKAGDRITISMPTCPQGIICFYAANKLGAVSSMIHPLSPPREIEFYLNKSKSRFALTLDAFYSRFKEVQASTDLQTLILARIPDYLGLGMRIGFYLTKGRKIPPVPQDPLVRRWHDLMQGAYPEAPPAAMDTDEMAVILYSGGTTGSPKGIMLSNMNFISEGMQVAAWGDLGAEGSILAILPIFHGFGLGVCVNAVFMGGGRSILVPQFTPETVAKLIKTKKPTFVVGVPTLFEALNRNPLFQKADLSCLKGAFSGADQLPRPVKEKFEQIVRRQGGSVQLREGYGLTEAVYADHAGQDRQAGNPGGSAGRRSRRNLPARTGRHAGLPGDARGDGRDPQDPSGRKAVAAYGRSGDDGRGRVRLFQAPAQAHDQIVGHERLSGPGRGCLLSARCGAGMLRDRRSR